MRHLHSKILHYKLKTSTLVNHSQTSLALCFQVELLLKLVPELIAVVLRNTTEAEEEQAINRQTALFSLKLLCKCFGSKNHLPFVPVLNAAIDVISSDVKEERNVTGSALLCVAEVTCVLKALAIPHLPRYHFKALLSICRIIGWASCAVVQSFLQHSCKVWHYLYITEAAA